MFENLIQLRNHNKETNYNTNIQYLNKILVSEQTENSILCVKVEISPTEEIPKCNQIQGTKKIVEKHVCESWHTRDLHVLVKIYRAHRSDKSTSIAKYETLPWVCFKIFTSLVVNDYR